MPEVSGWLIPGFLRALHALGIEDEVAAQQEAQRLLAGWSAPDRLFHNTKHLADILSSLDEQSSNVHEPAVLVVAAWYHGAATYDPETRTLGRLFNYSAAADQAINSLSALGGSQQAAARVGEIILMLTDLEAPADDIDACVFIAAVMSYLGVMPQRYREIRKMLRAEIPSLDDRMYYRQRRVYVRKLLEHQELFRSPLAREYEDQARQNLNGELAQLNALFPDEEAVTTSIRSEKNSSPVFKAKSMRPVARKSIMHGNNSGGPSTGSIPLNYQPNTGSVPVVKTPLVGTGPNTGSIPVVSGSSGRMLSRSEQPTPAGLPVLKSTTSGSLKPISAPLDGGESFPSEPVRTEASPVVAADTATSYAGEEEQSSLESVADVLTTLTMKKLLTNPNTGSFPTTNAQPATGNHSRSATGNGLNTGRGGYDANLNASLPQNNLNLSAEEDFEDESPVEVEELDVLPVSIDEEDN